MPGKHGTDAVLKSKNLFITNANIKHNNKYDYSKVLYINSRIPVIIICKKHGEFKQSPSSHLAGHGCIPCAIRYTNEQFIELAKGIHGDNYDYSLVDYKNTSTKVDIHCNTCNTIFSQIPNSHLQGYGCRKCAFKRIGDFHRLSLEEFIIKANLKHNNKYDYTKVVYVNNSTDIIIICPDHGEFEQTPAQHFNSLGCRSCSIISLSENSKKYTYADFIREAKKTHGAKYIYSLSIANDTKVNVEDKVEITCIIHGIFKQQINLHLAGANCKRCTSIKTNNKNRYTTEQFIELAKEIHDDKYDYSLVDYKNISTKVDIKCNSCNKIFSQVPNSHLNGTGCPLCNRGISNLTEFITKAKQIHGELKYNYSKTVYVNGQTKVIIICNITKREFSQTPANHLKSDRGCPCCLVKRQSKGQIQWLAYLSISLINLQHGLNVGEHKISSTPYFADGYDPDSNTVYEYNGCYWHGCNICFPAEECNKNSGVCYKELNDKTKKRMETIISKGYKYYAIWEHEWFDAVKNIKLLQKRWRKKHFRFTAPTPAPTVA